MANQKKIHIVAFNIPYPPNYGGIIDVYYKLRAIKEEGLSIILHCFSYSREEAPELEEICEEIHYYKRGSGIRYFLKKLPYIVITRSSKELEKRLISDSYPVLFEGLHTTYYLRKCIEAGKKVFIRTHNIEHRYYQLLARSNRNLISKVFFLVEAGKLARYEKILKLADNNFSISTTDTTYFYENYMKSQFIPAFHQHNEISCLKGKGDYILFHGNLSVSENEKAVLYLIRKVLSKCSYRIIIAGKDPSRLIRKTCARYPHIELIENPDQEKMSDLIHKAHINLLYTNQPTGLKLKLLHSLHGGRYCMANPLMLSGSGLEKLCYIYRTPGEALEMIDELMSTDFVEETIIQRKEALKGFVNISNAQKLIKLIYE